MSSTLAFKYTGGAANSDPNTSLGGTGSSVTLDTTALNNLFDDVGVDDKESSDDVNYRAIDLKNEGDEEARHVSFFLTDTPNSESIIAVWLDTVGTQSVVNEQTEPTGASGNWTTPLVGSKMSLSDLAAGGTYRLWVRRTVDEDALNKNDDTATLRAWFS